MDVLIKVSAIAIIGAVLSLMLKKSNPEIALLLTVAVGCVVLYLASGIFGEIIEFTSGLSELTDMPSASLSAVIKAVGIGIVTRLAADVCKDSGQSAVSSAVELSGTGAALFVALPLMKSVLEMIKSLL